MGREGRKLENETIRTITKQFSIKTNAIQRLRFYDELQIERWFKFITGIQSEKSLALRYPLINPTVLKYSTREFPIKIQPVKPTFFFNAIEDIMDFEPKIDDCFRNALKCCCLPSEDIRYTEGFVCNPYHENGIQVTHHAWIRIQLNGNKWFVDFDPTFFFHDDLGKYYHYYQYMCIKIDKKITEIL